MRLIDDHLVTVSGSLAVNPSRQVLPGEPVVVLNPPPMYVSRGGLKLEKALSSFGLDVTDWRCLDAGSSTGGFTDALLQHGAKSVVAVDVGTHQLHERLRGDVRVRLFEQTDIRSITIEEIGGTVDIVVADLSFISICMVLSELLALAAPSGHLALLVKPQFEADRAEVSRGKGIISDPAVWRRTLLDVQQACTEAGAVLVGLVASPIRGGSAGNGNVEFLLHLRHASSDSSFEERDRSRDDVMALIERVIQDVDPEDLHPQDMQQESS